MTEGDDDFVTVGGGSIAKGHVILAEPATMKEAISLGLVTKDLLEARLDTVKALNSAQFDELSREIEGKPGIWSIVSVVFGAVVAVFGILAFSGDRFDGGLSAGSEIGEMRASINQLNESIKQNSDEIRVVADALNSLINNLQTPAP